MGLNDFHQFLPHITKRIQFPLLQPSFSVDDLTLDWVGRISKQPLPSDQSFAETSGHDLTEFVYGYRRRDWE
jgi:hypothetical protein